MYKVVHLLYKVVHLNLTEKDIKLGSQNLNQKQ